MPEECFESKDPLHGATGILDVSGNEDTSMSGGGQSPEIVDHFVGPRSHECTILEVSNCLGDVLFGDINAIPVASFKQVSSKFLQ